jgi:type I restriction enzyme S subunit
MSTTESNSWRATKLKFAGRVVGGGTPESGNPDYWDGSVPWLTPVDLGNDRSDAIIGSKRMLTEAGVKAAGLERLPVGSVVFSTRAPIGSVGLLACKAVTNQGCKALVPDTRELDSRFGFYLALDLAETLQSLGLGTTFVELSTYALKNIPIFLPSPADQRRIAAYLDEQTAKIDRLMTMRLRQMDLLKEQRAALIQQAVTRGLNPNAPMKDSGLPWLGEIPAHWEMKRLKYLCSLLRDGTHQPPKRVEIGYPLLSVRNIQEGTFARRDDDSMISEKDFKTLNRSFVIKTGDILMAVVGATLGKVAVVTDMEPFQIQRSVAIMRPRLEAVDKDFLRLLIECQAFQKCIWSNVGFSAQPGIYLSTVGDLSCPLPSIKEQAQILEFIECETHRIDRLHSAYTRQLEMLTEYRTALIHECVTGSRTVPEAANA